MNFGKGMFLWKLATCDGGNPEVIADAAHSAGLSHVLFKAAHGSYAYNALADIPGIVSALHSKGIAVWGWHYITLENPVGDATIAVNQVSKYGLDGYCIDAESECKNKPTQTATFMGYISKNMKVPVALCSYRFPRYHPEISWKTFLSNCNYVMPQVYWVKATNPGEQLLACYNEYDRMQSGFGLLPLPMIPVGAAYYEFEWKPTIEEVKIFMDTAVKLRLPGFNFWEWKQAREINPEFWPVIANYNFGGAPVELTMEQKIEILWREASIKGWNLSI